MTSTRTVVVVALAGLAVGSTPQLLSQSSTSGSSAKTPNRSGSAESANLTPQEKEAQKHYRIALEAIKNSDLATAADELKSAAELVPKNALIWYKLADVESTKGDSALALEHLKKAETLGIPKSLQNGADELEAKLSYEAKRQAKKEAFSAMVSAFRKTIDNIAKGGCTNDQSSRGGDIFEESYDSFLIDPDSARKVTIITIYTSYFYSSMQVNPLYLDRNINSGSATVDLADLSPEVRAERQQTVCRDGSFRYALMIKSNREAAIHFTGQSFDRMNTSKPWIDGDLLTLLFPTQESADTAAKTLKDAILMSKELQ